MGQVGNLRAEWHSARRRLPIAAPDAIRPHRAHKMALYSKNAQADELARALSLKEELRAIGDRCAALPDYDKRSPEEIIGFDEHGLPA